MGDEQHRQPAVAAQLVEDRHHLGLRGDVERGGALVGQQQPRPRQERGGDHDALEHAAGQLVRILPQPLAGSSMPTSSSASGRPRDGLGLRHVVQRAQRLGHEVVDATHRVDVRARVLEHHGDLGAVAAQCVAGEREDVGAVEAMLPSSPRALGSSRAIALAVIDLPEPDSPTRPIASPSAIGQRRAGDAPRAGRGHLQADT